MHFVVVLNVAVLGGNTYLMMFSSLMMSGGVKGYWVCFSVFICDVNSTLSNPYLTWNRVLLVSINNRRTEMRCWTFVHWISTWGRPPAVFLFLCLLSCFWRIVCIIRNDSTCVLRDQCWTDRWRWNLFNDFHTAGLCQLHYSQTQA